MRLLHAFGRLAISSSKSPFCRCVDSSLLLDWLSSPRCGHCLACHSAPLRRGACAAHRGHHGLHGMHDSDGLRAAPRIAAAVGRKAVAPLVWRPSLGYRNRLVNHALARVEVGKRGVYRKAANPARPPLPEDPRPHHAAAVAIGVPWVDRPPHAAPSPDMAKQPRGSCAPWPLKFHDCIFSRSYAQCHARLRTTAQLFRYASAMPSPSTTRLMPYESITSNAYGTACWHQRSLIPVPAATASHVSAAQKRHHSASA